MARPLSPLKLNTEQRELLEAITRSREIPHSLAQRVRIILAADAGDSNKSISQALNLCEDSVGFWRKRWVGESIGLEKWAGKPKQLREAVSRLLADKPRPGSPGVFTAEQICQLLAIACETPPERLSHWTQPELAKTLVNRGVVESISASSVGRFLKSGGFKTTSDQILA
jgi:transposase